MNILRMEQHLFNIKFIVNISCQIAEGLKAIHKMNKYHGNLKATNVLLFYSDNEILVKLNDYNGFPGNLTNHKTFRMTR